MLNKGKVQSVGISLYPKDANGVSLFTSILVNCVQSVSKVDPNEVIDYILSDSNERSCSIVFRINPQYRAVVYGKKFANISLLRKFIGNYSGLTERYFRISIDEE